MRVNELTEGQKEELKIRYYDEKLMAEKGRNISCYEMVNINEIVSDEEIEKEYEDFSFVNDDFFTQDRNENFN